MEKRTIWIRKIANSNSFEKSDDVAVEKEVSIVLKNGAELKGVCTPKNLEEFIIGKRFLVGDLEETKLLTAHMEASLESVSFGEILETAEAFFEHPGALFRETGCAHSCALVHKGQVVCCIEDIGRHNALDKVIGYAILNKIPLCNSYVFTSGRISGDYLKKVIDAGIPMVVSRAAVTANAVDLAKTHHITMLGFVRKNSGNLYHEGIVKINE